VAPDACPSIFLYDVVLYSQDRQVQRFLGLITFVVWYRSGTKLQCKDLAKGQQYSDVIDIFLAVILVTCPTFLRHPIYM